MKGTVLLAKPTEVKMMNTLSTFYRLRKTSTLAMQLLLGSIIFSFASQASAACKGIGCVCTPSEIQFASPVLAPGENGKYPISLEADNIEAQGEDVVSLSGNAEVIQGRRTIVADKLDYYRGTERVVASGNVEIISDNGDYLSSDSIDVIAPTQIGQLTNTDFKLARSISSAEGVDTVQIDSRGTAGIVNLEGEGLIRLKDAQYTNCNEGNNSVMIGARELELDRNAGVGKAKNAVVRFKGVPIFYAPYISFPINDERKTGFLTPSYGSDEESGNIFEIPWYWNIAKNQDATITPRYYTDRGLQISAEYRHRSQNSNTFIYGEVLPDDDLFGDDRDLLSIQHFQQFTDNLSASINYNDVSDSDYFEDLRNQVRYFSATYVPRDAKIAYSNRYFNLSVSAKEYQIIDPDVPENRKPYERLPDIRFSTRFKEGPYGMRYGVNASYSDYSSDFRLEGNRTSITPYASLKFENIWGYVKPKVSVHSRNYSLNNVAEGVEDSPSFTVPIFSVDTGIYFEKNSSWFGDSALHTLEPRLYYVYAPDEDQSDVPLFGTSQVSLNNFNSIFRENRFYGEDRVGDTNQVTLGVTTRIIDSDTGDQRLVASFGQLYLFDDLEQNLNANTVIESGLGDFLAEMKTESKGPWTTYSFLQYDHDESEIVTARFALGYEPKDDNRKLLSLGYYHAKFFNREIDQLTLQARWPISDRWSFYGNERYSIEDSESLSRTVGLEYNSCCWKFRITGHEYITNRNIEDKNQSIFVELELTSLGRLRTGLFQTGGDRDF